MIGSDIPAVEHTLGVHSLEEFLTGPERVFIRDQIARSDLLDPCCDTRRLDVSVHDLPGLTAGEASMSYQPNGRAELRAAPEEIGAALDRAFARSLAVIRAVFPTAVTNSGWILVAYTPGQFIVPHVDLPDLNPLGRTKIAGLSVLIQAPEEGGEFFIETSSANGSWREDGPAWRDTPGEFDRHFRATRRSRWTCRPRAGDALLYGSRLAHGTLPVVSGMAVKALGFLY